MSPGGQGCVCLTQDTSRLRVGAECRNMGSRTHCAASSGQISKSRGSSGSGGEVKPINSLKPKSQADKCSVHAAPAALSPGLHSLPLSLPWTGSPPEVAQVAPGHQPPPHPQGGVSSSKPVGQNAGCGPRTRRVGYHPHTVSLEGGWVGFPLENQGALSRRRE